MNFDDDDDSDFNIGSSQPGNKLASLFKSNIDPAASNESLKYKAPKQPQAQPAASQSTSGQSAASSVLYSSTVKAFKYANNKYEDQGRLGLAILHSTVSGQTQYRLLLYTTTKQTAAAVRVTPEFKISVQKNNYVSLYDEQKQLWSILFDSEDLIASFATQIVLCKCNLLQGNIDSHKLHQELKVNDEAGQTLVEVNDSVEAVNVTSLVKDQKLVEIENNSQKPFRFKLGKNKVPQSIEELIVGMKQGDRKLMVLNGNSVKSIYPNAAGLVVFYDITILRIKKSSKEDPQPSVDQMPPLPLLAQSTSSDNESRSRSESIRDKTKIINDQLSDPKTEKAKLISRMAKMGQQMLPSGAPVSISHEPDEDWQQSAAGEQYIQQQQQIQETMASQSAQMAAAKTALLIQNQQLQQQLALQSQQLNQAVAAAASIQTQPQIQGAQLAVYKPPYVVQQPSVTMYSQPEAVYQQQIQQPQPPPTPQPHFQAPELTSIQSKLEQINEKLETIRASQQSNLPNMETSVLLHNIQRLVRENEQYKKDLFDKGAKIEEQNSKITELLSKQQSFVEQSHQILESKNSTFQVTSEKAQQRVLELEKEKLALTQELTESTGRISQLNLEINRMRKDDLEMRQQLAEVSKNTDQYKQTMERLTVENADLQAKLDTQIAEVKKEKSARKSVESKLQLSEDEVSEVRANLASMQKLVDERKRKAESERAQFDAELDELKKTHQTELLVLKDKLARLKSDSSEAQNERIKQIEEDLVAEWRGKMEQALEQTEQKYERKVSALETEIAAIKKQFDEAATLAKTLRLELSAKQSECDDLTVIRDKYERLQSQALLMKERYETRIKELLDAEPDAEVIGEEIKKLMNLMYRRLKAQIKPDQYYSGNGILTAMLKMIKLITLQVLNNQSDEVEEDKDVDYFSQHIYQAPSPSVTVTTPPIIQSVEQSSSNQQETSIQASDQVDHVKEAVSVPVSGSLAESLKEPSEAETKSESIQEANKPAPETESEYDSSQVIGIKDEETDSPSNGGDTEKPEDPIESKREEESNDSEYDLVEDVASNGTNKNEETIKPCISENVASEPVEGKEDEKRDEESVIEKDETETGHEVEAGEMTEEPEVEATEEDESKDASQELKEIEENTQTDKTSETDSAKYPEVKKAAPKNLFDDDGDDDENNDLFSFSSKPVAENTNKPEKEENKSDENQKPRTTSNTGPLSLKLSPPPLFDEEEDDKDIDWFK